MFSQRADLTERCETPGPESSLKAAGLDANVWFNSWTIGSVALTAEETPLV